MPTMKRGKTESDSCAGLLRSRAEERLRAAAAAGADRAAPEWEAQRLFHELEVHKIELELQNAELVQAREETEIALDRFTDLFESGPVGFLVLGRDGGIRAASCSIAALLGIDRSRFVGRRFGLFLAEESRTEFAAFLDRAFSEPAKICCDVALLAEGKAPVSAQLLAKANARGEECNVALIDISQRRRTEDSLQKSELRYRGVVEDQAELIARFRPDGTYTFVNTAHCLFFGTPEEEVIGSNWHTDVLPGDASLIEEKLRALSPASPVVVLTSRAVSCTGDTRWMQFTNRGFFDGEGRLVEIQAVGRDITELKRVEKALKRYTGRLLVLEDELRKKIAGDLHDEVAQDLIALGLNLNHVNNHLMDESRDSLHGIIEGSLKLTKEVSRRVRNLMVELHPQQIEEFGLVAALSSHVEKYAKRTGIEVVVNADGNFPRLTAKKETALFRIAQEALQNILKHAEATSVNISLRKQGGVVLLTITDDGKGFLLRTILPKLKGGGWGLTNMRERAELIGGRFRINSVAGKGTAIEVETRWKR
jgi:PAS domain S-box-containing protein